MSSKKKIIPHGDRVLVRVMEGTDEVKKTKSGIYLPETAGKGGETTKRGTVVSVGEGKRTDEGVLVPFNVSVGDEIIFSSGWGDKVTFEDEDYNLVSEASILAIIK